MANDQHQPKFDEQTKRKVPPCSGHAYQQDDDDQTIGDWSDGVGEGDEDGDHEEER